MWEVLRAPCRAVGECVGVFFIPLELSCCPVVTPAAPVSRGEAIAGQNLTVRSRQPEVKIPLRIYAWSLTGIRLALVLLCQLCPSVSCSSAMSYANITSQVWLWVQLIGIQFFFSKLLVLRFIYLFLIRSPKKYIYLYLIAVNAIILLLKKTNKERKALSQDTAPVGINCPKSLWYHHILAKKFCSFASYSLSMCPNTSASNTCLQILFVVENYHSTPWELQEPFPFYSKISGGAANCSLCDGRGALGWILQLDTNTPRLLAHLSYSDH